MYCTCILKCVVLITTIDKYVVCLRKLWVTLILNNHFNCSGKVVENETVPMSDVLARWSLSGVSVDDLLTRIHARLHGGRAEASAVGTELCRNNHKDLF